MRTFKHSGDLGDIVFALPTIRAMGGGILYLDPTGGANEPMVKWRSVAGITKLNRASVDSLKTLLARIPYISEVRDWDGETKVDCNLDAFVQHMGGCHNLSDAHLAAFNLASKERNSRWLEISDPLKDDRYPIIIARSLRYHSHYCWWALNAPNIVKQAAFVGLPFEHQVFEATFDVKVHYWPTPDALTLARVIAGAKQFISNQSFPHAIAEAMKMNLIQERYALNPATIFEREGAQYV